MAGRLQQEIGQTKPFGRLEGEAFLNIHRTAALLDLRIAAVLKPYGLSPKQYNVLRILRGAGDSGATCKDIIQRMVTPDPDLTRLVDRLEKRGLVARARTSGDRRYVAVTITEAGLKLLEQLEQPVEEVSVSALEHLGTERVRLLIDILEEIRSGRQ